MSANFADKIKILVETAESPLVVGVTGHRNLVKDDYSVIFDEIKRNFEEILTLHKAKRLTVDIPSVLLFTGLAQGADMLAAKVAHQLHIPYVAVLPCELDEFKTSFDDVDALNELDDYIENAYAVVVADDIEKNFENQTGQTADNYRYRQVGIHIVQRSSILLALWDGKPPKSRYGCGTADVVKIAKERNLPILWITCRRIGDGSTQNVTTRYL